MHVHEYIQCIYMCVCVCDTCVPHSSPPKNPSLHPLYLHREFHSMDKDRNTMFHRERFLFRTSLWNRPQENVTVQSGLWPARCSSASSREPPFLPSYTRHPSIQAPEEVIKTYRHRRRAREQSSNLIGIPLRSLKFGHISRRFPTAEVDLN